MIIGVDKVHQSADTPTTEVAYLVMVANLDDGGTQEECDILEYLERKVLEGIKK